MLPSSNSRPADPHRALKGENIILTRDRMVKLRDFGIAKVLPHRDRDAASSLPNIG
jgi:serine/threonine protein kinase